MNIYYLYNSGFTIEAGEDALIIDYYRGSLGKPWRMPLGREPSGYRNIHVFASHVHGDHYNRVIFDWLSERPDIHYILSDDVSSAVPKAVAKGGGSHRLTFLGDGSHVRAGSLDIRAFGSTDAGISFHIVTGDGARIFHAGDLNYWHWQDESTPDEIAEAYAMYAKEINKIQNGVGALDVAFFPVDPRMGSDYYRGAVMFCEAMKPKVLVPMHFSSVFSPPPAFYKEVSPFTKIARPGPGAGRVDISNLP